jgi:hypothetical protein
LCEYGDETAGSIKGTEFLEHLSKYQMFKKGPAAWLVILHSTNIRHVKIVFF